MIKKPHFTFYHTLLNRSDHGTPVPLPANSPLAALGSSVYLNLIPLAGGGLWLAVLRGVSIWAERKGQVEQEVGGAYITVMSDDHAEVLSHLEERCVEITAHWEAQRNKMLANAKKK